jgi:predicted Fe-S protein YdhL (DUF1289 family)
MAKRKSHPTTIKLREQRIEERYCAKKGCKFFGKLAQQGICFQTDGEIVEWAKLDEAEREILAEMKALKKAEGKRYLEALEAHYVCAMLNWEMALDETIKLRRDLALAKLKR